jgi:hypothetical protein
VDDKRARRLLEHLIDLLPLGVSVAAVVLFLFYWT